MYSKVVLGVRVMAQLGANRLIVTNAAGGLNPEFNVGDVVVIKDHINLPGLCGMTPLIGQNVDALGPRFPPMSDVYDQRLQSIVAQAVSCAAQLCRACTHKMIHNDVHPSIFTPITDDGASQVWAVFILLSL